MNESGNSRGLLQKGIACVVMLALSAGTLMAAAAPKPDSFYDAGELFSDMGMSGHKFYQLTVFGPTGLQGWLLGDNLVVREVEPGSPADGVMKPADVIQEVNGVELGEDPLKTLGLQIIESEKTGSLKLTILRNNKAMAQEIKIKKFPLQGKDWPFDCPKSEQVLAGAASYLAKIQLPEGGFDTSATIAYAMAGLLWLGSDDAQYLQNCRRLIDWLDKTDKVNDPDGTFAWGLGYGGVFLGEYYLKTGDKSALKLMKEYGDRIVACQDPRGGWTHGHPGGYGYVQGGLMNPAGAGCWLALELLHECGVSYPDALKRARHYFMRYIDRGTLSYGDQFYEFQGSGNSKDSLACLALHVKGEKSAAALVGHIATDFYESRNRGHTGGLLGFGWGMVAGNFNPHRPDYRRCLDHWNWLFHVGRRWDGGFHFPGSVTGGTYLYHGSASNTGCVGLTFGVPTKSLRIFGKGESVFGDVNLAGDIKKGLALYQSLKFDELRKLLKDDRSEFAQQLLKATDAKEQDIASSIKRIKEALAEVNPVRAEAAARTLDAMCAGQNAECKALLAKAGSDEYATARKAADIFEENRFYIYTEEESRQALEKLAADKASGIYQKLASETLAIPSDAFVWVESATILFYKCWSTKETDPVAMRLAKRLASIKGGNWATWFPNSSLRKSGAIKDTFVDEWTALLPASGLHEGQEAREFAHLAVMGDAEMPPPEWNTPGFDDSAWARAVGPMSSEKDATFRPVRGASKNFFRIPFNVDKTDFSEWKVYINTKGRNVPGVVYLNGECIAWVDSPRSEYEAIDLPLSALKFLKKGDNVLAVRTAAPQSFDVGLYAKEKK